MTLKFEGLKAKRNFHTDLNLVLFSKVRKYEIKYRTKICDFTVSEIGEVGRGVGGGGGRE